MKRNEYKKKTDENTTIIKYKPQHIKTGPLYSADLAMCGVEGWYKMNIYLHK